MIPDPPETPAQKWVFLQKNAFPTEKCTFLQKNALSCRKMTFPTETLRLLNALDSEDRGLKVRFSLATIVSETFELILCQMLSSQGEKRTFKPLSSLSLFSAFSNLKKNGVSCRKMRFWGGGASKKTAGNRYWRVSGLKNQER